LLPNKSSDRSKLDDRFWPYARFPLLARAGNPGPRAWSKEEHCSALWNFFASLSETYHFEAQNTDFALFTFRGAQEKMGEVTLTVRFEAKSFPNSTRREYNSTVDCGQLSESSEVEGVRINFEFQGMGGNDETWQITFIL
jgi:hypothetical protein